MAETYLQIAISNTCIATALAMVAWIVHRRGKHPQLAHVLWLLVLVKLVTPPLFSLPVIPVEFAATSGVLDSLRPAELTPPTTPPTTAPATMEVAASLAATEEASNPLSVSGVLLVAWLLGSLLIAAWSLARFARFRRLLARASKPAPERVQRLAADLANTFSLGKTPKIQSTVALVSPFVWWSGWQTRLVIPQRIIQQLSGDDLSMVLAHELAHLRRKDHWVRWIEWFASVVFWWNPIAWLARRGLRTSEELACDLLVLDTLNPDRRTYGNALLSVAESLCTEALRPPAVACAMNHGGSLEQRLNMIISNRLPKTPTWLLSAALAIGAMTLPLSVAEAQDFNAIERRLGGAVEAGEITVDEAKVMMDALRRSRPTETKQVDPRATSKDRLISAVKSIQAAPPEVRYRTIKGLYSDYERQFDKAKEYATLSAEEALNADNKGRFSTAKEYVKLSPEKKELHSAYESQVKRAKASAEAARRAAEKQRDTARETFSRAYEVYDLNKAATLEDAKARYAGLKRHVEELVKNRYITKQEASKRLRKARQTMFPNLPE